MIDRLYIIEEVEPNELLGINKEYLLLLRTLYPRLRLVSQGRILKIVGSTEDVQEFVSLMDRLVEHVHHYATLSEEVIRRMARGQEVSVQPDRPGHILYGNRGKSIAARGKHQQQMVQAFEQSDLMFAIGPAGTGKTFIAISLAVKALKNKQVRRIILSRPAVEAGEKLGFLPGEMKDKLDPYLQPLYDALEEMIPLQKLKDYIENGTIQIAPLAYMRGRTLNDAVVILDEAQNTTNHQMKMFLTRLGNHSKMIITGDVTQIDLPRGVESGLKIALRLLQGINPIAMIHFDKSDIVRHPVVQLIVEAYDRHHPSASLSMQQKKEPVETAGPSIPETHSPLT